MTTKKTTLTRSVLKPTKAPTPAKTKPIKPENTQTIKIHTKPKAKTPKATARVQKVNVKAQQLQQAPQIRLSDFRLQTTADNIGIHITTTYLNNPIHRFTLPVAEYGNWQSMTTQHKHMYVQARVASAFFGDLMIINLVVTTTIQILDNIFARAQAQQHRQQQIGSVIK